MVEHKWHATKGERKITYKNESLQKQNIFCFVFKKTKNQLTNQQTCKKTNTTPKTKNL